MRIVRRVPRRLALLAGTAVVLAVAAAVASSTSSGESSSSAASPIEVGFETPLTGNFAANGTSEMDGFKLGLHDFGQTVNGHKIQVTYVDTQSTPNVAVTQARFLVTNKHIDIFESPLISSGIAAVAPYIVAQNGIPTDDLYLASPEQMQNYLKYGIGHTSGWTGYQPSSVAAKWAYQTKHYRRIAVVGQDFSFGWQVIGGFAREFESLGGKITKKIWLPSNATDMSPYISQIPKNTDAVYAEVSGVVAVRFVDGYKDFGLKDKIPLIGVTQMTGQSALPSEKPAAALGLITGAQYCDGIPTKINQTFANAYHKRFKMWPAYYSDAGYTKARILVSALKKLHGDVSDKKAVAKAMRSVKVVSARGPIKFDKSTWAPIQNMYICQVKKVNGSLRNVPIATYKNIPPWGTLKKSVWLKALAHDAAARP